MRPRSTLFCLAVILGIGLAARAALRRPDPVPRLAPPEQARRKRPSGKSAAPAAT